MKLFTLFYRAHFQIIIYHLQYAVSLFAAFMLLRRAFHQFITELAPSFFYISFPSSTTIVYRRSLFVSHLSLSLFYFLLSLAVFLPHNVIVFYIVSRRVLLCYPLPAHYNN